MTKISIPSVLSILALSALVVPAVNAGSPDDVYPRIHRAEILRNKGPFSAKKLSPQVGKKNSKEKNFFPIAEALRARGIVPSGKTTIRAEITQKNKALPKVSGGYTLEVSENGIKINAFDEAGVFYAAQTLAQMIEKDGMLTPSKIVDAPDLPFRGSIEGFYGKPWEHERRLSQIRFYGKYKMNAYIYGPKDDPYSGFNSNHWRDSYPAEQAKQISELVKAANENHVNFIWALHPGGSIRWHDNNNDGIPDDVIAAQKKFEAMYALGVRAFAVFFDDIGGEGAKAEKQAEMLNYLNREFIKKKKDVAPLLMCPTDYAGPHGSPYKKTLGEKLDKDINIMWTGPSICSDIPANAVETVSGHWQRKPFIWWNWPVDDYCRTNLLLGRTYGLDKGNKDKLSGFASNPMDKPEASKIALFGVGDWSWNIEAFDSDKSWRAAFSRLYPNCDTSMFVFAKHNSDQGPNGHGYRREESVDIAPAFDKALAEYRRAGTLKDKTTKPIYAEFTAVENAAKTLEKGDAEKTFKGLPQDDPALWHEIEYWVKSFAELGELGKSALELVQNTKSAPKEKALLFSKIAMAKARQQDYFAAQKKRHFEETFPSDKQWSTGCRVGTRVLTPFVDELVTGEWKKFQAQVSGNTETKSIGVYKAFTNAPALGTPQAERAGGNVSLRRILEVVKLAPKEFIGLSLPEGIFAKYIHIKLDNPNAANACAIEVSRDGKTWTPFNARVSGSELQNPVEANDKIRFFRLINKSSSTTEFRINLFKFDIPADSKENTEEAISDNDLHSFYTITASRTFVGPKGARPHIITDAKKFDIKNNTVTVSADAKRPARIFEIFWK